MIKIDVMRDDGEVTRLIGESGIAVCSPNIDREIQRSEAGTVSIRCSNVEEIVWNLATILAAVDSVNKDIIFRSIQLMTIIDATAPVLYRKLPEYKKENEK